jgi:hypothetical protein
MSDAGCSQPAAFYILILHLAGVLFERHVSPTRAEQAASSRRRSLSALGRKAADQASVRAGGFLNVSRH